MSKKTVVVGMSGGVDSSLSAILLKEQGYNVIGMFMKNWEEDQEGICPAAVDFQDVVSVCTQANIPYYSVNFSEEYKERVFADFLHESKLGNTPNPDILCNREIKFQVFFEKALSLGADYLATGHYCQRTESGELLKGLDPGKDQSYFLYTLSSQILKKVLFPVGGILKSKVRSLASQYGLSTAEKKDSTGICFIGKRNFKQFLSQHLECQPGYFENLKGEIIGQHEGIAYYTIGQRKGLKIGGAGDAWFVVGKDVDRQVVIVEQGSTHPALYCDELEADQVTWISGAPPSSYPITCSSKIRYRQEDQNCIITKQDGDRLHVQFLSPQRAATPGQSIVFYHHNICLGGAIIRKVGPSYYEQGKQLN